LLVQRPDLRGAQARVVAADHRLASAIADLLPAIRLSGSTGYQSPRFADLLESWAWNVAGSLSAPLFEGGRRWAEVQRSRAALTERLQSFASTLLVALREVEDALVQERKQKEYMNKLKSQLDIATANLREARGRYVNGLVEYLNVLTALSSYQNLEQQYLEAKRATFTYRVQLCRALGGSWSREIHHAEAVAQKTEEVQ
jgi:outer membrane protein TolC